jgi:large subunit ribosomal protein L17
MLANMASSLIDYKRINTTVAKAKALKQFVEPLITKSKTDSTQNRRLVFSALRNKYAVAMLFRDVAPKIGDRPGGYTRVIKMGNRLGDNAAMALIELVDFNEVYNVEKIEAKKTTRRSRSRKKSITTETPSSEVEDAVKTSQVLEDNASKGIAVKKPKIASKASDQNSKKNKDITTTDSEKERDA